MADPALPILQAQGVSKSYRQGAGELAVLRGVDFSVRAGEFVAVLGPSGSGKSTLLHLLGLMDRPSVGEVFLHGRPSSAAGEEERAFWRRSSLGFVFQFDSLLPEFTVLENVAMPGRIARRETAALPGLEKRARELLERVGIADLAERFPQQLSGGERQRAAVARAMLLEPAAILADEPTGNLDRPNGELVFNTLRDLAGDSGVAVVVVTHNEEACRLASRTVHLVDGRIGNGGS